MKYRFHPLADEELDKAADYYEDQQERLGLEFAEEIYSTIQRIVEFPQAWTPIFFTTMTHSDNYNLIRFDAVTNDVFAATKS